MKIQILKGVFIKGQAVFPFVGEDKEKKETIIEASQLDAKCLIEAGQAKPAEKAAKITQKIDEQNKESDKIDEFFGENEE